MSRILQAIIALVQRGEVHTSAHGYDELAADNIVVRQEKIMTRRQITKLVHEGKYTTLRPAALRLSSSFTIRLVPTRQL